MTITELEAKLKHFREIYGDIEVYCPTDEHNTDTAPITSVTYYATGKSLWVDYE